MIAGSYRYLANRKKKKNDERSTGAAGGHRDPHIEFSARSNKVDTIRNELESAYKCVLNS